MYVSVTGSYWSPRLTPLATVLTGGVRISNCANITYRHMRFHRLYVTAHSAFMVCYYDFFSRSSRALMATITVLAAISAAPKAGVSSTPQA